MRVRIRALGVPVSIEVAGDEAQRAQSELRTAWGACLDPSEPTPDESDLVYPVSLGERREGQPSSGRRFRQLDLLMDATSSGVTQTVIDARSRDLLLLHAAGLAGQSGRVAACVAASGTGKTTLARSAAGHLRYVTDETVGVTHEGTLVVYPKPLSLKQASSGPKEQVAPDALGLEAWPVQGPAPTLGKIVLLSRNSAASRPKEQVSLVSVAELDAVQELVPQISYLGRLDAPLQRLAGLLSWTGGAVRADYREAEHLVPVLARILESHVPDPDGPPAADSVTAENLTAWAVDPVAETDTPQYRSRPVQDWLVRGSECLVLSEQVVFRLSSIGGAILAMASAEAVSISRLTAALVEIFGAPPDADPRRATRDALVDLIDAGLVSSEPAFDGGKPGLTDRVDSP